MLDWSIKFCLFLKSGYLVTSRKSLLSLTRSLIFSEKHSSSVMILNEGNFTFNSKFCCYVIFCCAKQYVRTIHKSWSHVSSGPLNTTLLQDSNPAFHPKLKARVILSSWVEYSFYSIHDKRSIDSKKEKKQRGLHESREAGEKSG